uniref:Uncharacterized protein n=1 Tax=Ralstonia solanacearum TaxID=305 RepID=A0A0S4TMZ9_RALSL|nr:protein of unknown function [Ralstonia solanacearum]
MKRDGDGAGPDVGTIAFTGTAHGPAQSGKAERGSRIALEADLAGLGGGVPPVASS